MHRKLIPTAFVLLSLLLLAMPVHAITFGQPDGDRHPNVGVMVVKWTDGSNILWCSGSLIAPTVFLTAAHCTAALVDYGIPLDDVWVTFDAVADESATLYHGTADLNPNFGKNMANLHDVAVIVLDEPVEGITPVELPTAGLLDQLKDQHALKDQTFVAVGYGLLRYDKTRGPQSLTGTNERHFAEQSFLALKPYWIQFSMNPSTGNGGTCYGDSGGPHFLGDTNLVVAVTTTGDYNCRATDVDYRLDTDSAREYLAQFVTLP